MNERKMRTRGRGKDSQWVNRVPEGHGDANQEGDRATVAAHRHKTCNARGFTVGDPTYHTDE